MENKIRNCSSHSLIAIGERSSSIERVGGGDFVKICEKISGPYVLGSGNPIPQQKSQHKFHAPTK